MTMKVLYNKIKFLAIVISLSVPMYVSAQPDFGGGDGGDTSNSPNYKLGMKNRDLTGSKNGMYGKKRPDTAKYLLQAKDKMLKANRCPVFCENKIYNSVGEAQSAFLGISIRKRIDNPNYPNFYRLKPKTKRK
jgi:hypothetical protein